MFYRMFHINFPLIDYCFSNPVCICSFSPHSGVLCMACAAATTINRFSYDLISIIQTIVVSLSSKSPRLCENRGPLKNFLISSAEFFHKLRFHIPCPRIGRHIFAQKGVHRRRVSGKGGIIVAVEVFRAHRHGIPGDAQNF